MRKEGREGGRKERYADGPTMAFERYQVNGMGYMFTDNELGYHDTHFGRFQGLCVSLVV